MESLAIIGTGIAGMACGYTLRERYRLALYERNSYVGGHTNTVTVDEDGTPVSLDTGFMVYNEVTYPQLTKLFRDLQVPTQPTSMSFSVRHDPSGLEFCGSGWDGLFAQRRNLLRLSFWRLLREIDRFNRDAVRLLDQPGAETLTLAEYARTAGFSSAFLERYLIPMSGAVWSTPPDLMLQFPAVTLIRFFQNHGFLGLNAQHPWRTVSGGSWAYRDRLIASFREHIKIKRPVVRVSRRGRQAAVSDLTGETQLFDRVILACHADEALTLLDSPTDLERSLLSSFTYQRNIATVHTDETVMPQAKRAWSSWNYRSTIDSQGKVRATTIYAINSLQKVSQRRQYFVSINDPGLIDPSKVLRVIDYQHPLFSVPAIQAQSRLSQLNQDGPVYFCGSYFKYGFHEDALVSALTLAERLKVAA